MAGFFLDINSLNTELMIFHSEVMCARKDILEYFKKLEDIKRIEKNIPFGIAHFYKRKGRRHICVLFFGSFKRNKAFVHLIFDSRRGIPSKAQRELKGTDSSVLTLLPVSGPEFLDFVNWLQRNKRFRLRKFSLHTHFTMTVMNAQVKFFAQESKQDYYISGVVLKSKDPQVPWSSVTFEAVSKDRLHFIVDSKPVFELNKNLPKSIREFSQKTVEEFTEE